MSSNPRMPLGGAIFPLFPYMLCCDLPLNVIFSCSCGRYSPISRVIRRPAEPRIVLSTSAVIRRHPASEPPRSAPVPVLCSNAFSLLSEESLYDSPLDLGLSVEALAAAPVPRARRHCISSAGIGAVRPGVDAQASSVNSVKPAHLDQVTFPVLDVPELDTLISRAPLT